MARILAVSSYVACGHVGLAAIVPALQAFGHEVVAVPTVVLSNHYGHAHVGGSPVETDRLSSMLKALAANRMLDRIDAVITGFLPSAGAVAVIADALESIGTANAGLPYLCDPVLGDDPGGLYVSEDAAAAIHDRLVPLASIVTPNRFELEWLTGLPVATAQEADAASSAIGADMVAATSIPAGEDMIANVLSTKREAQAFASPRLAGVPHGTGDLFAALLLGHRLNGAPCSQAVARASAGVETVIAGSLGAPELRLVESLARAVACAPAAARPVRRSPD
ncbi:MAG: pyridoxal kinase [Hyphomicrobiaceae bacterium]